MPFSDKEHKQWTKEIYARMKPETVVDIGIGSGTYAKLLRGTHSANWIGIEAWAQYVTQWKLEPLYNKIVIGDVRYLDLNRVCAAPDLVIIGDCVEHLDMAEALDLIERLKAWAMNIIVSLPVGEYPQGAYEGNWFEAHKSTWSHEQMVKALGDGIKLQARGEILSAFLWSK
jgi:hypothetical protein